MTIYPLLIEGYRDWRVSGLVLTGEPIANGKRVDQAF
eukprot:SAG31_NODE_2911_length_4921_cov_2.526752_1_plen_37_part_00